MPIFLFSAAMSSAKSSCLTCASIQHPKLNNDDHNNSNNNNDDDVDDDDNNNNNSSLHIPAHVLGVCVWPKSYLARLFVRTADVQLLVHSLSFCQQFMAEEEEPSVQKMSDVNAVAEGSVSTLLPILHKLEPLRLCPCSHRHDYCCC